MILGSKKLKDENDGFCYLHVIGEPLCTKPYIFSKNPTEEANTDSRIYPEGNIQSVYLSSK